MQRNVSLTTWGLLIFLLAVLAGCKKEKPLAVPEVVKPVKLMTIESARTDDSLSLPGKVRASRRSELSFKVSGPLVELPVEEGQFVKKGQLIARILERDFRTAISEARAREVEAEKQNERYKKLYTKRQVSKADFDQYRASRDITRAQLEEAENALVDTRLLVPFDGIISKRMVENFEKVQTGQPIANLHYIDRLEVLIDVPELMMNRFTENTGIALVAEFEGVPDKQYPLTLKEYSTEADSATRTYQVVLEMNQPSETLILPGMTAKVIAVGGGRPTSLQSMVEIPAIAVLNDTNQLAHVWRLDRQSMTVSKQLVGIDQLTGSDKVRIVNGLEGGDEIVVAGVTKLREGLKVRVWEEQREGK